MSSDFYDPNMFSQLQFLSLIFFMSIMFCPGEWNQNQAEAGMTG